MRRSRCRRGSASANTATITCASRSSRTRRARARRSADSRRCSARTGCCDPHRRDQQRFGGSRRGRLVREGRARAPPAARRASRQVRGEDETGLRGRRAHVRRGGGDGRCRCRGISDLREHLQRQAALRRRPSDRREAALDRRRPRAAELPRAQGARREPRQSRIGFGDAASAGAQVLFPRGHGGDRFSFREEAQMKPINVGLLGIGTVGGGTWNVLARNREEISRRAGRDIRISVVADKEVEKAKTLTGGAARVVADAFEVVRDPEIDIVIELIGGYGVAKDLVLAAIEHGKHVVTANKALLATHGNEIFAAAQKKGVMVAFEGAVAGGIPIIKALREGLTANRIEWIAGIINGTTNFILSEMRSKGLDFDVVLKEAQRLGYAESDPTFDIEGIDAAHKLTILSAIAFGIPMQFDRVSTEGISKL